MIYNKLHNTYPSVLHKSGPFEHEFFNQTINKIFNSSLKIKGSSEVTIITWNNTDVAGVLQNCLNHHGLEVCVLGKNVKNWRNPLKIELFLDFIDNIKTPYVLGLDDFDVVLFHDIDEILRKFKLHDCQLLYNAGPVNFPAFEGIGKFEKNLGKEYLHPYLNAGVFMGNVEFCKEFYSKAYNQIQNKTDVWARSEQIYIKNAFPDFYPNIKIDYRCEAFQIINSVSPYKLNDLKLQKPKIL